MNDLDREKLIAYVLGRMSPEDARSFEDEIRADSSLAHALSTIQDELVNVSSHSDVNLALDDALRRRLPAESFSSSPAEADLDVENNDVVTRGKSASPEVEISRSKRLRFIPKRVVVPRREEVAFVFKRASILTDEERSRRLLKPSRFTQSFRRSFLSSSGLYRLAEKKPNSDLNVVFSTSSFDDGTSCLSSGSDLLSDEETFVVPPVDVDSDSLQVETKAQWNSGFVTKVVSYKSDELQFVRYSSDLRDVAVLSCPSDSNEEYFKFDSGDDSDVFSRFTLNPLAYTRGRVKPVDRLRRVKPYSFGELRSKSDNEERNRLAKKGVPDQKTSLTREEVLEEIAAIFGQSSSILQNLGVYLAVAGETDDENGPTLTAEDLRLAELLGHTPNAIERNEYYWEEEGTNDMTASDTPPSLLARALLIATAPPVYVGSVVLKMFRGLESRSVDYSERGGVRTPRDDGREPGRLIDVAIPLVAGVVLAVGVVFPLLKYVTIEIITTVAESKVRKLSGNLTVSPHDPEVDVIPFISEQILFPHYEAVEFNSDGTMERNEMESDGYPVFPSEK